MKFLRGSVFALHSSYTVNVSHSEECDTKILYTKLNNLEYYKSITYYNIFVEKNNFKIRVICIMIKDVSGIIVILINTKVLCETILKIAYILPSSNN